MKNHCLSSNDTVLYSKYQLLRAFDLIIEFLFFHLAVKRHKSFSGGETTPTSLHRYKNISPNKSFNAGSRNSITAPSPVQVVKSSSRGTSSADVRYESTPSPGLSRFKSNELLLSAENTPSPGCLSRRNTYHSLITSDESHAASSTDLKRRNSFQEILKQDGIQLNRPSVKTKSVYGKFIYY